MAERQGTLVPTREQRRVGRTRPLGSDAGPFRAMQRLADEMDRMFDDFGFGHRWRRSSASEDAGVWAPDVEVFQKNNQLTIRADLPGLRREDITVDLADNEICIQGERRHERDEEHEGYYRSERGYGAFSRVIPLPEGTITEQAKAEFKDGVLEITMPAPPASKGRRLEIAEAKT